MSTGVLSQRIHEAPLRLIATRIKRARKSSDASTLDKLAAAVGTSRHHLIRLEKAEHRPRPEMLTKIAEATGKPVEWFLNPDLDPSPFPDGDA